MKRILGAVLCLLMITGMSLPTFAQSRGRYAGRASQTRRYDNSRRDNYSRRNQYDRWYQDRSFWDAHRDKITVAAGTGAGAVIGGLAGGKKGAIIGALLGAGGSALYTYKLRNRDDYRYYRQR